MARDYAKAKYKVKQPSRRKPPKKSTLEGKLWIVVLLLIILFIAGLFFLNQEGAKLAHQHSQILAKQINTPHQTVKPIAPEPRFDFYTMLPGEKTKQPAAIPAGQNLPSKKNPASNIPASARDQVASLEKEQLEEESNKQTLQPPANVTYLLQFGLFKDFEKADELKAQLTMLGVEAKIKTLKKNGYTLYRVGQGPFKYSGQAQKMQEKYRARQIKSLIVKDMGGA